MKKILAISSIGGHWVQLLRIVPALGFKDTIYVSTHEKCKTMIPSNNKFYKISDFSRWNPIKIIPVFLKLVLILVKENPKVIISTGAAPGLIAIVVGKLFFKKTIWIDSIANVEELSLSGKIASKLAARTYTQWSHLAIGKVVYHGNILS